MINNNTKKRELIQQIESLQNFYYEIGYDSDNIKTIFSLTLSYLKGQVNQLLVKSFFDVLMNQNRLGSSKELNLLNCFDRLIEDSENSNLFECEIEQEFETPIVEQSQVAIQEAA